MTYSIKYRLSPEPGNWHPAETVNVEADSKQAAEERFHVVFVANFGQLPYRIVSILTQ